jgi:uncharacterized protein
MPNPVVHFEVVGKDLKLMEGFYKDVFAWQITPGMSEYAMIGKEDGGIAGGIGAFVDTPSYITFYVEVADIHAALQSVENHGGKKLFDPHPIPDGSALISNFTDPEGHIVGLIQRTPKN